MAGVGTRGQFLSVADRPAHPIDESAVNSTSIKANRRPSAIIKLMQARPHGGPISRLTFLLRRAPEETQQQARERTHEREQRAVERATEKPTDTGKIVAGELCFLG